MRKVVVSEFVSLDGVIEEPLWSLQLTGEEQQKYKLDELSASDALLLGRATYEEFAAEWPHLSEQYGGYTDMMNSYPKHVVSTTLQEPLEWNAKLIEGDVAEEVTKLKQEPGKDILVYGSGDLVNTLMKHNLVDEYRLMVFPIVVGSGKRLFEGEIDTTVLELVDSKTFGTGVVVLTYQPAGRISGTGPLAGGRAIAKLPAQDLERARAFYRDKLGLVPVEERDGGLRYVVASGEFHLFLSTGSASGESTQIGFEVEDLDAVVVELRSRGVVFEAIDAPGYEVVDGMIEVDDNYPSKGRGERGIFFHDSEGNLLALGQAIG